MNLIDQIYDSLKWKKPDKVCAQRLGISLDQYRKLKQEILEAKQYLQTQIRSQVLNIVQGEKELPEDRIIERNTNLQKGTQEIKALSTVEPSGPQDVERILKIEGSDTWKLSSYWNKQQPNGMWLVSGLISRKQTSELSLEDVEEILGRLFQDKQFKPVKTQKLPSNSKALMIYTSDKHIAAHVNGRAVYENEYNSQSFESRMKQVAYEIQYLASIYGRFDDIFIIDLGDKMDGLSGYTTRGGHKLPQNMTNREAFETCVRVEKEFLDLVIQSDLANKYHVVQHTVSNHGGDFDYMVSRAVEIYLNARYPDVNTIILEKFIEHVWCGKHVFLLTHGKDDEDMKHGLPLHLNEKTENYLNKYLMYHKIDTDSCKVSLIKGDLHTDTSQEAYGFRYRNVLSLFGGSKWIGHNFGPTHPGCSYDIVEKNTDRIYEGKILFGR